MGVEFIPGAGACLATRNVMERVGRVRWMVREKSNNPADNGWRIMSVLDSSEYLNDPKNWMVVDFNDVCTREPALVGIWDFPVGSDLQIVDDGQIQIVDTPTGRAIPVEEWYVPESRRDPSRQVPAPEPAAAPPPPAASALSKQRDGGTSTDTRVFAFIVKDEQKFVRSSAMNIARPPLSDPAVFERTLKQLFDSVGAAAVPRIRTTAPSGRPVVASKPVRMLHLMIPPDSLTQPLTDAINRQIAAHPDVTLEILVVPR